MIRAPRWIVLTAVGLALAAGVLLVRAMRFERVQVPVVRVGMGSLESWISTNGIIEPVDPQVLRARVGAFVDKVPVVEGAAVERGDLLLTLDVSEQRADLARAREEVEKAANELRLEERGAAAGRRAQLAADLKKAEAEVAQLRRDHDALTRLVAKQSATRAELEQTDLALARAETTRDAMAKELEDLERNAAANLGIHRLAVQRSRDALRVAEAQVGSATIRAPVSGTVYSLPVRAGTRVEVGAILAAVADLRSVQLRAFVDAAELASVQAGQAVEVTWSAVAGHAWKGRTERVPRNITTRGERRVGEVICSIANDNEMLIPNLDVDVRIRVHSEPQALLVPRGAVRSDAEGRYVFLVRGQVLHRTTVELGAASPASYAIVSGLRSGDTVALPTNLDLRDGMRVDVVPEGR